MSCSRWTWRSAIGVVVFVTLAVAPQADAQQGEWRVGGRLIYVDIGAESNQLSETGSRIVPDSSWTADFDATYMIGTAWGMEFMITAAPHDLTAEGGDLNGLDIGSVWVAQSTITINYHIQLWGKWKPYVGAGLGTAYLFASDTTDGAAAIGISEVGSSLLAGGAGQVGVTFRQSQNLMFNFDIKYNAASGDVKITNSAGESTDRVKTDINAWIIGLGAAFRF